MIQLSKLTVLFIYEIGLIFVVLFGLFIFHYSKGKAQTSTATKALWQKRKATVENCRDDVYRSLEEQFNYTGAKLEAASKKILDRENLFFNNVQNRALKGDNGKLISGIHNDFYYVLNGYRELTPEHKENHEPLRETQPQPGTHSDQEYEELANKNRQLVGQLNGVMTTMDDVLEEYSKVFDDDVSQDSLLQSKNQVLSLLERQKQLFDIDAHSPESSSEPPIKYNGYINTTETPVTTSPPAAPLGSVLRVGNTDAPPAIEASLEYADDLDISNDTFLDTSLDEFELASL